MHKENFKKVKKYLFYISVLFIVLISVHLFYLYLYDQAKQTPINWGVVSEWIYWKEYSKYKFNPLTYWKNNKHDYIINFLYRGLLTYDPKTKKIVSNLAKCDYSNLANIKCVLSWDAKWSNGDKITAKDVLATFKIIKDKWEKLNRLEYFYLKNTKIFTDNDWAIIFRPEKKDVNFVTQVLFQPIVSEKTLNAIWENELFWKFDLENEIFSWEYIFDSVVEEENTGILKMKLKKNPYYNGKKSYINEYIFKFAWNPNLLISNSNIFDNKDWIIKKTKSRFNKNPYYLNNFLALFINADKIKDTDFRKFLLYSINKDNIINLVSKVKKIKEVDNPYFIDGYILDDEVKEFDLDNKLKSLWYLKKSELLKEYLDTQLNKDEKTFSWTTTGSWDINEQYEKQKKLSYVISDKINKGVNFISWEAVIEWKLNWETPKKVIINHNWRDIKLNSLAKNNYKKFYFALREDYNTLKQWKNLYKIYFDNKDNLKEQFYVFYSKDLKKLEEYRKNAKNLLKESEKQKENQDKIKAQKDKDFLQKIKDLDDNLYYDKDLKPFTLVLYYIESEDNDIVAENIVSNLKDKWIIITPIVLDLRQLIKKISSWEKNYDLILTWVNLWYFKFNISRYFYSWASKTGFNFSNIRSSKLDTLLEELNENFYIDKERLQRQYKVLWILKEKQIVKTFYSVENTQFVDKIIQNYSLPKEIPNYSVVYNLLENIYTKSEKQIDWNKKSILWYFSFLKSILVKK